MLNKIYDKLKEFLKENIKQLAIIILIFVICNVNFPYYIDAPGSIISTSDRISISGISKSGGDINMASVTEIKAIIPTLIWAFFDKNMDIVKKEEKHYNNETYEEANIRSHLLLNNSTDNALVVAFSKANKSYKIVNVKTYIAYIDSLADTDLQIGDEIISINNSKIVNISDVKKMVEQLSVGDIVNVLVKRNDKEINASAKVYVDDNNKYIGISTITDYDVETEPKVEFKFKESESGPSGGLMLTLAIYNSLIEEDITKGKKIVGTGTIALDGTVGEIGGIKYKLIAAAKEHADIFIVPKGNYEEAKKVLDENKYNIKLISVSTFDETLEKLKSI